MTTTIAPYIAADTYTGRRWSRTIRPGSHRSDVFTAAELAAILPGEISVWKYVGVDRSGEVYARTRMVPQPTGELACYDSTGRLVLVHPADRHIRILTK